MKVNTREQAWIEANKIIPTDYEQDDISSQNAGYPIYVSTVRSGEYGDCWISDLGNRLEVNVGATTTNIWIDDKGETLDKIQAALQLLQGELV